MSAAGGAFVLGVDLDDLSGLQVKENEILQLRTVNEQLELLKNRKR